MNKTMMNEILLLEQIAVSPDRANVLRLAGFKEGDPLYAEGVSRYESLIGEASELINARTVIALAEGNRPMYIAIMTIGGQLSDWSAGLLNQGNFLGGLIADALADDALFKLEGVIAGEVATLAKKRGLFVTGREEVPGELPPESLAVAAEMTQAEDLLGIKLLSSYMFDPVKTLCVFYQLGNDAAAEKADHDCSVCELTDCNMRRK